MLVEIILTVIIILAIWSNIKKPSNYPPGPWGLPLFGYLPFDISNFDEKINTLKKKHGDIIGWRIGCKYVVFLTNFKVIKDVMKTENFAVRPKIFGSSLIEDGFHVGVINTNGLQWQKIRRFMLHHLRDLGMGKSKIMSVLHHEASELVKVWKKQDGKAAPIPFALSPAVINILWQMVASKRHNLDDEKIIGLHELIARMQESMAGFFFLDIFPWVKNVAPSFFLNWATNRKEFTKLSNILKEMFRNDIKEHIAVLDENNPRDFIDEYLIEMKKQESDPDSTLSHEDLIGCLADLFFGGIETTTVTLTFSVYYLAAFPEVQKKIHKEIDNVLPPDTLVLMEDKPRLPYTEAFIYETLRYSSLAAFGGIHSSGNDTTLGGYTIPKDSIVLATLADIHFDPKYYKSPNEFRPERFLNSEGKVEIPKEGFLPFGIGKRVCLGESLARMELFVFLVTLLQHLEFSIPPGKELDIKPLDVPLFHPPKLSQNVMTKIRI